jgi:hypothetical protein
VSSTPPTSRGMDWETIILRSIIKSAPPWRHQRNLDNLGQKHTQIKTSLPPPHDARTVIGGEGERRNRQRTWTGTASCGYRSLSREEDDGRKDPRDRHNFGAFSAPIHTQNGFSIVVVPPFHLQTPNSVWPHSKRKGCTSLLLQGCLVEIQFSTWEHICSSHRKRHFKTSKKPEQNSTVRINILCAQDKFHGKTIFLCLV